MVKKVVVLRFPFDREHELREAVNYELKQQGEKPCSIGFVTSASMALEKAGDAHIVIANAEECGDFFERLLESKYKGHVIPVASSKSQMSKHITWGKGKSIPPTNYCGLTKEIMLKLGKPTSSTKENIKQEAVATD